MVAKHINAVADTNRQGVPSLVDVLNTLAAYWRLCECGLEIGKAGYDGWEKKGLRLGSEIDSLSVQIPLIKAPSKKAAMQVDLANLNAKSEAINKEWGQAHDETDAYRELFWDAREFCVKACGIGDSEVFNAALIGFDPSQLKPGQEPSKHRMSEIVLLLRSLQRNQWETQPWANPTKPTMRASRQVTPDKLNSFNVRKLKSEAGKPKHGGTMSGSWGQLQNNVGSKGKRLGPMSVLALTKLTGLSRTTLNDELKNGNIPGGAERENGKPRGHVILTDEGLDYLKRKGDKNG